jgi:phage tail sheath protein FI
MPTYQAPDVYVEETGFRRTAIAGVETSVVAFVGSTPSGPATGDGPPPMLASFSDFERIYGGSAASTDALTRAVRAFFDNGGRQLHVARIAGPDTEVAAWQEALDRLLTIGGIAIIAAPGASALPAPLPSLIAGLLIDHAETHKPGHFALIDPPPALDLTGIQAFRASFKSSYAALYYPWILADSGDAAQPDLALPPSGFIAGIYARVDTERGVHKAPANEVVVGARGLQRSITTGEQEILNPAGINCIRKLPGRGIRVWGARTLTSDPEWKYANVRRLFLYLETSLDRGLQWTLFEPNAEPAWARVRAAVGDFLTGVWRNGALLGTAPDDAFFVRCDRTTMTQADLDAGRLVCLVGITPTRPAEFVIFRLCRMTADAPQASSGTSQ